MDPIYLPTHRIDLGQLVNWTYAAGWKRLLLLYICIGFLFTMLFYAPIRFDLPTAVLYAFLLCAAMLITGRLRIPSVYKSPGRNQILLPRTMVLDSNGFQLAYQNGVSTRVPWNVISKKSWSKDFLALYSPFGPILVPRGILTSEVTQFIENSLAASAAPSM